MKLKTIDGLPVIDAKHDLMIDITSRDCTAGDPLRPETCAAARATKRHRYVKDVRMHITRAYVRTNDGNYQRYIVTERLKYELIAFDRGGKMQPGRYMLLAPKKSQRLGQYHSGKTRTGNGKKRRPTLRLSDVRTGPAT